jgi:hypothetical protein
VYSVAVQKKENENNPVQVAKTLPEAIVTFYRFFSPRTLTTWFLLSIGILVWVIVANHWHVGALWGVLAVVIFQPFLEWSLHILVLHDRPRTIGSRKFDTVVAKDHRMHHLDPRAVEMVFIPSRWVIYLILGTVVTFGLMWVHFDLGVAATVLAAQAGMGLFYEWCHYLIHSDVVARNPYFKAIKRAHRNHHYRNSTYWLGVTSNVGDMVLGTYPDPKTVPVVEWAKDLLKTP